MMEHSIPPLFNAQSEILILGSFPSVKSREQGFFYGHPQNRFWRVLAAVLDSVPPQTVAEKKELLLRNHIAVWDVIARCEIEGSADSSIKNVQPNDLQSLLAASRIRRIFLNGQTAARLYKRYMAPKIDLPAAVLPSTSPAHAAWNLARLCGAWQVIKNA